MAVNNTCNNGKFGWKVQTVAIPRLTGGGVPVRLLGGVVDAADPTLDERLVTHPREPRRVAADGQAHIEHTVVAIAVGVHGRVIRLGEGRLAHVEVLAWEHDVGVVHLDRRAVVGVGARAVCWEPQRGRDV